MRCDVAVVGAGAAGVAAAVAAGGLRVIVIEREGFVGGLASSAMVGTLCGLYYRSLGGARYAVRGFARMFAEQLEAVSGTKPVRGMEGLYFLPYEVDAFHREASRKLRQHGVWLRLHSLVTGVEYEGRRIVRLTVHSPDEDWQVETGAVIDCTGEARLSRLAGLPCQAVSLQQANAFVFRVAGLPDLPESALVLTLIRALRWGIEGQALERECEGLSIVPGSVVRGSALLKLGMPRQADLTQAELTARARSHEIVNYLCGRDAALADMRIVAMAPRLGVRSGPRPRGLTVLDEAAVLECAKPDDGVAIGAWPMEYWGAGRKPKMRYFPMDEHYLIPAPALVSRDFDNLFFAGRGFSATEMAMASARVIGTCLGTGYAAGVLAAAQVGKGDWRSGVEVVRREQVLAPT